MRLHFSLLAAASVLTLTACSAQERSQNLESLLQNPLFAERYAEEIVQSMVEMKIAQDPLLEEAGKEAIVDSTRQDWNQRAADAKQLQREGRLGLFIPIKEHVTGEVLVKDSILYFGPTFEVMPGPALHLYYTTAVDPRDVEFPDETAIDLGLLQSPYGAQQFTLPVLENPIHYRTIVLWDAALERLYGFAQISEQR
jgi:hypothetical protein